MKYFFLIAALFIATSFAAPHQPGYCPPNEVFFECGSACEPSCENPNPNFCTLQCILNVCQCAPGFVRSPWGCVLPEQCYMGPYKA